MGFGGCAAAAGVYFYTQSEAERLDVILHTVKKEPLIISVTEKGTLESARNIDLVCKVRAGTKGFSTSINWVIDDGSRVKPGQLLMELDDSALKDQRDAQVISIALAEASVVKAKTDLQIAELQHESNLALARTALTLSEIELDKLTGLSFDPELRSLAAVASPIAALTEGGSYRQELDDLSGQISLAQATVEQSQERAAWADRMVKLTYMPAAQAQAEHSKLASSVENLRSLHAKKSLLISHDRRQRITDLTSKRNNAFLALETADLEGQAKISLAQKELDKSTYIYTKEKAKLEDPRDGILQQLKECKIYAPDDIEEGSMVVYFKSESSSRFSSNSQALVEQGAQVKEGQKLLRIPNLSKMQVSTKVHEAMVSRIRGDVRVPTKAVEFTQVAFLANLHPLMRLSSYRPEIADMVRDEFRKFDPQFEYKKIQDGQQAVIRLDSLANRQFVGQVQRVAAVASQADSWLSDVKLYQTLIRIEGELAADGKTILPLEGERLKPDMTAEVVISVDAASGPVLTVPIQAVLGGAEMGERREVFVKRGNGFERRSVLVGLANERMAEIRKGLTEGDEIVINPKVLMDETDRTKTRETLDTKSGGDRSNGEKGGEAKDGPKGPGSPGAGGGGPPGAGGAGSDGGESPKKSGKKGGFPKGGPGGGPPGGGGGGPPAS